VNLPSSQPNLPLEVTVEHVKSWLDQNAEFLLLDCREVHEHATAHIAGSMLIPMNELPLRVDELQGYRDQPIVVQCHGGVRSLRVTEWLRDNGFSTTQSMAGGIDAWSQRIDPTVPRY